MINQSEIVQSTVYRLVVEMNESDRNSLLNVLRKKADCGDALGADELRVYAELVSYVETLYQF